MKKLGKKKYQIIETVEAYAGNCSGIAICNCGGGSARMSINNKVYNAVYASL